ncbi:hypothetical protein DL96DRAFT_1620071 [Flagelloscypha sp. PMI_526]|nr:hypothetical protein DL96DRAFT_1620071 [Flagelloscypha sp. PMI_526]
MAQMAQGFLSLFSFVFGQLVFTPYSLAHQASNSFTSAGVNVLSFNLPDGTCFVPFRHSGSCESQVRFLCVVEIIFSFQSRCFFSQFSRVK